MKHYETLFIAHPNLEEEGLSQLLEETRAQLKKRGGKLVHEGIMGKKRLAYSINKQKYGTYILLQYSGDGSGNERFSQDLELNSQILAHITVKIEEEDIHREKPSALIGDDSDEIIAGEEQRGETTGKIENEDQKEDLPDELPDEEGQSDKKKKTAAASEEVEDIQNSPLVEDHDEEVETAQDN